MAQVKIEIENTELAEMGIDQPKRYAVFHFAERHFLGYWVSNNEETLSFYIGSQTYLCKNCQLNVELFETILKDYGQKADTK